MTTAEKKCQCDFCALHAMWDRIPADAKPYIEKLWLESDDRTTARFCWFMRGWREAIEAAGKAIQEREKELDRSGGPTRCTTQESVLLHERILEAFHLREKIRKIEPNEVKLHTEPQLAVAPRARPAPSLVEQATAAALLNAADHRSGLQPGVDTARDSLRDAMFREIDDLRERNATLKAELLAAAEQMRQFSKWRDDCHAYDEEIGEEPRPFEDGEEWGKLEQIASTKAQLYRQIADGRKP